MSATDNVKWEFCQTCTNGYNDVPGSCPYCRIHALTAQLDAKDALIRAGERVIEAREKLNKAKMGHGLFEARHNLDAAQVAYQSLRKP